MGLLDDAIREHLDLKRRRGADPTEIERAEREALGPVRRGPEVGGEDISAEADVAVEGAYPPAEPEAAYPPVETEGAYPAAGAEAGPGLVEPEAEHWERFEEDPELEALEHHDELPPYEPARAPEGDPLMEDERHLAGSAPADSVESAEPDAAPHPADPPLPSRAPHRADIPPHLDQETEEYDLESEHEADDVLETTPEFLQDAPEHDRLWFEQRPPRDFDFDG